MNLMILSSLCTKKLEEALVLHGNLRTCPFGRWHTKPFYFESHWCQSRSASIPKQFSVHLQTSLHHPSQLHEEAVVLVKTARPLQKHLKVRIKLWLSQIHKEARVELSFSNSYTCAFFSAKFLLSSSCYYKDYCI